MKTPYEPPILRTHRLITGSGTCQVPAPDIATAFVATVAANPQTLARQAPTRLHIAPPREDLHARLREAARLTKAMREPSAQEVA